jgi:hypothetical protein
MVPFSIFTRNDQGRHSAPTIMMITATIPE